MSLTYNRLKNTQILGTLQISRNPLTGEQANINNTGKLITNSLYSTTDISC